MYKTLLSYCLKSKKTSNGKRVTSETYHMWQ